MILAAIDFSDATPTILRLVEEWARKFQCPVCLLHVAPPNPSFVGYEAGPQTVRDQVAEEVREEHRKLHEMQSDLKGKGLNVHALLIQGPTAEKIVEEAERQKAGLIIMGSHGHGAMYHLLVGSVSDGVLRKATCPVLIIPCREKT